MRTTIIALLICVAGGVSAQELRLGALPMVAGKVMYEGVVQVDSVPTKELYNRAKRYLVHSYVSAKDVIQLDDAESGEVIAKGYFEENWMATFYSAQPINVWNTFRVQVKDGRYKYTINDFSVKYYVAGTATMAGTDVDRPLEEWPATEGKNAQRIAGQINDHVRSMIAQLESAMRVAVVKDDW